LACLLAIGAGAPQEGTPLAPREVYDFAHDLFHGFVSITLTQGDSNVDPDLVQIPDFDSHVAAANLPATASFATVSRTA
jgi:hypothetical protein